MSRPSGYEVRIAMKPPRFFLLLCTLIWIGCERGPTLIGQYEAFDAQSRPANLILKLEADGRGSWSFGDDYVEIRWKADGSQIIMRTQSGGVFTGTLVGHNRPQINISHANIGYYEFRKSVP